MDTWVGRQRSEIKEQVANLFRDDTLEAEERLIGIREAFSIMGIDGFVRVLYCVELACRRRADKEVEKVDEARIARQWGSSGRAEHNLRNREDEWLICWRDTHYQIQKLRKLILNRKRK